MTRPRKALISLADTPYYHITSCCVRRSFLCCTDNYSGRCYEHRQQWIVDRIRLLSSIFAVDICSYAMMSNHYHLVVKIDPDQVAQLPVDKIIQRWRCLYKGPTLVQRYIAGEQLSLAEHDGVTQVVEVWRKRLANVSWFMRCLNFHIVLQANNEDQYKGHFWEARFASQALKKDEALLSCMTYVDLNPIRAGIANTPEVSDYTSIQERITPTFSLEDAISDQTNNHQLREFCLDLKPLLPFLKNTNQDVEQGIPFAFSTYLELLEWTKRAISENKRSRLPKDTPRILRRMRINKKRWLSSATQFELLHRKRFARTRAHLLMDSA